jgi:hypothetical protein
VTCKRAANTHLCSRGILNIPRGPDRVLAAKKRLSRVQCMPEW